MATRFYLTNAVSALTPSADASWENNPLLSSDRRRLMTTTRIGTPFASYTNNFGTINQDSIILQFISAPLAAQTVSGNVKAIIRASEGAASGDYRSQMNVRILAHDSSAFRGTLLAHDAGALASEWATTLTNRKFPVNYAGSGGALTPVAAQLGDRLVVEFGYRTHSSNNVGATLEVGDVSATDLVEDEVGTTQDTPWIEFDNTITFAPEWSGRTAQGTDFLTRVGRFDQGGNPEGGAESYALLGGVIEGSQSSVVRRGRAKPLMQEVGPTVTPVYGMEIGLSEGARSDSLRSPIGGGGFPSGSSAVEYFKMRALASPGPGYVTWVVSGTPDFAGAQAPASIQPGTAVVSDYWVEV